MSGVFVKEFDLRLQGQLSCACVKQAGSFLRIRDLDLLFPVAM